MNNVPVAEFGGAVWDLLTSGRGKNKHLHLWFYQLWQNFFTKVATHPFQNILQTCQ